MNWRWMFVLVLVPALGCGGSERTTQSPAVDDLDVDDGVLATSRAVNAPAPTRAQPPPVRNAPTKQTKPRFRGRRIDLDLVQADLHNVFRLLADVGGTNIVVGDDVSGAVTLRLRRVPWDQVLHTIARLKGLDLTREGNIYMVTRRAPR